MTSAERSEPALDAAERPMLEGWLDYHRETLAMKCAGLMDAQLREASVPPSAFTLLGLVQHLAEVERFWFREILAGEELPDLYSTEEDPDGDFKVTESTTWAGTESVWRAETAAARESAAGYGLDDFSQGVGSAGEPFSLRWIYTHMIEEYARHNGHADLVRERVDGATGD
ncbi:Mini-circle protein [Streptomyces sp. CB00316]|uniref:DinB family protein n=1 Tax=unclassified Streptomyces TaxID=2593676 RepID=UPI00093BD4B7|nr:DinB family protein [Streptomyces sp. CB00316]OKJ17833.1 Mini-circle protein [Streptomyces sp. CB00316]